MGMLPQFSGKLTSVANFLGYCDRQTDGQIYGRLINYVTQDHLGMGEFNNCLTNRNRGKFVGSRYESSPVRVIPSFCFLYVDNIKSQKVDVEPGVRAIFACHILQTVLYFAFRLVHFLQLQDTY